MSRTANPFLLFTPALVMFVLVISGQRSEAVSMLPLTGTDGEWQLTWTDPTLTVTWDGDKARPGLTKAVTFKTLDPISILFQQTKPSNFAVPEIRFLIKQDEATNGTSEVWTDFHLTLKDGTPQVKINHDGPDEAHPADPHFHSRRLGANLTSDKLKFLDGADNKSPTASFITLGDGLVEQESTLTISNFVIHEWMVEIKEAGDNSKLRTFEFIEQPTVPEPTTLLLWGTTMAGLGLAARWRRRRQN
jgi:MYXO-CTERM domain-containing protein